MPQLSEITVADLVDHLLKIQEEGGSRLKVRIAANPTSEKPSPCLGSYADDEYLVLTHLFLHQSS